MYGPGTNPSLHPILSLSQRSLDPCYHSFFVSPWLLNMMLYRGDREETQRLATTDSCSHQSARRTKGEGMAAEIQEPVLCSRSWSHGACAVGGRGMELPSVMLPKVERGKKKFPGFPLPPALPSPASVKMSEGMGHPLERKGEGNRWIWVQMGQRPTQLTH